MADTTPSPVSALRAFWLCILLLFSPNRFSAAEELDNDWRSKNPNTAPERSKIEIIRTALLSSFIAVVVSAAVGYTVGYLTKFMGICFFSSSVAWIQIVGASVLLWGTLFIRGYEIATYCGVTYSERVNQWFYRGMYCLGTSVAVFSLAVQQCKI